LKLHSQVCPPLSPLARWPSPNAYACIVDTKLEAFSRIVAEYLQDSAYIVRWQAVNGLATMGARSHANRIADMLWRLDKTDCGTYLSVLERLDSKECSGQVAALIRHEDPYVRLNALRLLTQWKTPQLGEAARVSLRDGFAPVREQAILGLASISDPRAAEEIGGLLQDLDPRVRSAALSGLEKLKAKALAWLSAPLLNDMDANVRQNAVLCLAQIGDRSFAGPLVECLKDEDVHVRWNAIEAICRLGATECADRVAPLLNDASPTIRAGAAQALVALDDKRLLGQLRDAIERETNETVKEILQSSFRKLETGVQRNP
jgi:HEAT repeat protein